MSAIFSIFNDKGGVGKSFIATNLAATFSTITRKPVLLIDWSTSPSRAISTYLDIEKERYLNDLLALHDKARNSVISSFPVKAKKLFSVLSFREDASILDSVAIEQIVAMIERLTETYAYIFFDFGVGSSKLHQRLLEISDLIILPFDPDPLSLISTEGTIAFLKQSNFSTKNMIPVLNKEKKGAYVDGKFAVKKLGREIGFSIPYASDFQDCFVERKIHSIDMKDSMVAKSFAQGCLFLLQELKKYPDKRQGGLVEQSAILEEDTKYTIKNRILEELIDVIDLYTIDVVDIDSNREKYMELHDKVRETAIEILDTITSLKDRNERENIIREVIQDALGLGVIEDLLVDAEVTEIMVNNWQQIYYEKLGRIEDSGKKFMSEKQLMMIIDRIISPLGRRLDTSSPMVDGRLKDGSRVNAIIPPISIDGAAVTIRKFGGDSIGIQELINYQTLNEQIAEFLKAAVYSKLNIIVSGGTGSGKTTLLNVLSSFIPMRERIITIEDSAELQLRQPHVIRLEARPPNIEGAGEITIRDLVRNALRMRPDRIVIGECRAGEALDMLQAMNTGHDGSLTTLHSNSPKESLSRLETLVMFAGYDFPVKAIREQIAGAVNIIIQLSRLKDGSRRIIKVTEVSGIDQDNIKLNDIYVFQQEFAGDEDKITGNFVSTGYIPDCLSTFEDFGINMAKELFWSSN